MLVNQFDIINIALYGRFDAGGEVRNVYDFVVQDAGDGELQEAAVESAFRNAYALTIPHTSDGMAWYQLRIENRRTEDVEFVLFSPEIRGDAGGTLLPRQNALLVTCASGGKGSPAKKYFPGLTESQWDGVSWAGGVLTAFEACCDLLRQVDAGTSTVLNWVRYNKVTGQFWQINGVAARTYAATQRRRKPGVGV